MAAAAGLSNFVRITAGAMGTSISTTIWENRATLHHAQLTEQIHHGSVATSSFMSQLDAAGMSPSQIVAMLGRMVDVQAYMLSANDVFYVSALLFLVLIAVVWMARPVKSGAAVDAGGAH